MRKKKQKRKKKTKSRKKSKRIKSRKKSKRIKKAKKSGTKELIFKVPKKWSNSAYVSKSQYEKKYKLSINDNEAFWKKEGKRINWIKPYTKIKDVKYNKTDVKIKWFYDGTLNASANCIDRHLNNKKNNKLKDLQLIKQSRLSVVPIDSKSWKIILKMGNIT